MKTYYATHALGRASSGTADADAICQHVNRTTSARGDSLARALVQAALDEAADSDTQSLYKITVESADVDVQDD